MHSHRRRLRWTLVLILSLFAAFAWADTAERVEAIFKQFDQGDVMAPAEIQRNIALLESLIDKNDISQQNKLISIKCWNPDFDDAVLAERAIEYASAQLAKFSQQPPSPTSADLQLCLSWFQQVQGDVDTALQGFNLAIEQAYQLEDSRLVADGRSIRGGLYSYQGNFAKALEDLITAQQLYEKLGLSNWALVNLSELATSYRRFGDATTAISYYQKLEAAYRENGDELAAITISTDIAFALEELGEYEQALDHYLKSYQFWKNKNDKLLTDNSAVNIASDLLKLNRIDEALQYLDSVDSQLIAPNYATVSFYNLSYAEAALKKADPSKAIDYLTKAEAAFRHTKNTRGMAQLYQLKSDVFQAMEEWQQAFEALQTYTTLHLELDKNMQLSRTTEMRTRFDSQRIENENQRLIENQQLKDHELQILEQNKLLQLAVIIMSLIIMAILSIFTYKQVSKSKSLAVLALTDHLTQLPNRRYTYSRCERIFETAKLTHTPMSVILFDADHFKSINDTFGHDIGDKVLIHIADVSSQLVRPQDLVGRVGGEEFLIVLPETDSKEASEIAARLITEIADASLVHISPALQLTVSAGVATLNGDTEVSQLINRADQALYQAKSAGRNRSQVA